MANEEHLAQLKRGVKAWNEWREANPKVRPNLSEADLAGANLERADLRGANLAGANLRLANLIDADLADAGLSRANFYWANLRGADFHRADLRGAHFVAADLTWAKLGAADLSGSLMGATVFASNDLSTSKGLDAVQHQGPSSIGIDTIYKSQGKIPLAFLRGCGVPENFITYMSSLTGTAFEFYSCFVSHSTKDQEFAERLYADLQNKGVRCWFAPEDIQGGKFLDEQIDTAIRMHEKVLLILSPASIHSEWVQLEVGKAREREAKEGKRVLFPVRLVEHEEVLAALRDWVLYHGKEGKESAREIRRFYIPDFSHWKEHDLYKKEFEKLVRDLRVQA